MIPQGWPSEKDQSRKAVLQRTFLKGLDWPETLLQIPRDHWPGLAARLANRAALSVLKDHSGKINEIICPSYPSRSTLVFDPKHIYNLMHHRLPQKRRRTDYDNWRTICAECVSGSGVQNPELGVQFRDEDSRKRRPGNADKRDPRTFFIFGDNQSVIDIVNCQVASQPKYRGLAFIVQSSVEQLLAHPSVRVHEGSLAWWAPRELNRHADAAADAAALEADHTNWSDYDLAFVSWSEVSEVSISFDGASWANTAVAGSAVVAWAKISASWQAIIIRTFSTPSANNHWAELVAATVAVALATDVASWIGRSREVKQVCCECGCSTTVVFVCVCQARICQTCWKQHEQCFRGRRDPVTNIRRDQWRRTCGPRTLPCVPETGEQAPWLFNSQVPADREPRDFISLQWKLGLGHARGFVTENGGGRGGDVAFLRELGSGRGEDLETELCRPPRLHFGA